MNTIQNFYAHIKETAIVKVGGPDAAKVVGPVILRAFVAQEILAQSQTGFGISPEIVDRLYTALVNDFESAE